MAIKSWVSGEAITSADLNVYAANSGLQYVTSASLTTVTNTISNAFNDTFDSYRIVINGLNNASTTTRSVSMRMGTDNSANYVIGGFYVYGAGTNAAYGLTGQTSCALLDLSQNDVGSLTMDIHNPKLAKPTAFTYQAVTFQSSASSNFIWRNGFGVHNVSTGYTSFQIIGTTDNLSGTVTVYGYRKA